MNLCAARNIVRYQYRIDGEEYFDDFCLPWLMGGAAYIALAFSGSIPCLIPVSAGFYSYFIAVIMKILLESEVQLNARGGVPGFYLSSPPIPSYADNRAVIPANADYVQIATIVEVPVGSYTRGAQDQYSQVPIAFAPENSNAMTKNYI